MIPPLSESGFLPPGIHAATLTEFEERFVHFDRSDRRIRIFNGMRMLFAAIRKVDFIRRVYVAGSFVSAKAEPNDFDCLLVLDGAGFPQTLRPFEYQLVSRRAARKEFGGDVITVLEGSELHRSYLSSFKPIVMVSKLEL
jgi:hypothetical protein